MTNPAGYEMVPMKIQVAAFPTTWYDHEKQERIEGEKWGYRIVGSEGQLYYSEQYGEYDTAEKAREEAIKWIKNGFDGTDPVWRD